MKYSKVAFIFPGQGAQKVGMGKDFVEHFSEAKFVFEEASDLLNRNIGRIVWEGPDSVLTETRNSQVGIFVTSYAILSVIKKLAPHLKISFASGLSLGEYTALAASEKLLFQDVLSLVDKRGLYMNEACEAEKGTMAVVMGMEPVAVEKMVKEINLPSDLWVANYNCPGQIVISGTLLGVETAMNVAKQKGAKRVLPLSVYGAFHSGLMQMAEDRLKPEIMRALLKETDISLVMNYSGEKVEKSSKIAHQLIKQVTSPVRWEQGIRYMDHEGVDLFIEIGPGKVLAGMNKKIGVQAETISIEKIEDLKILEEIL